MTQPSYPQHPAQVGSVSYETRRDTEAALAAQRELGPEYSEHIAAGLAERVEQLAAYRTAELRQAAAGEQRGSSLEKSAQTQRFVTALSSVVAGIPISIVGINTGELVSTFVCWAGLVGVNVAQAWGARRRR